MQMSSKSSLLEVRNVTRRFGNFTAVDDVSFHLPGEHASILAIAGESGSGKSTLASMLLGFIEPSSGEIEFAGRNIAKRGQAAQAALRREIQAVFQDPFDAFNPFYPVEHVLQLAIDKFAPAKDRTKAGEWIEKGLRQVRLDPAATIGRYPHQLSGGQLQRIMIARALLIRPRLIVADEPVSMIDASLRAIVLDIMATLRDEHGISQIYITHDLSSALQICDAIVVLYRGMVVESGDVVSVIGSPKHPYTQLLVSSIPVPDPDARWKSTIDQKQVVEIAATDLEVGCKFKDRCPHRMPVCERKRPPSFSVGANQKAACFLYEEGSEHERNLYLGENE